MQLRHFYKKQIIWPLFPNPNYGAAFVPKSETSLARLSPCCLKMADKKEERELGTELSFLQKIAHALVLGTFHKPVNPMSLSHAP